MLHLLLHLLLSVTLRGLINLLLNALISLLPYQLFKVKGTLFFLGISGCHLFFITFKKG
jgi:hypothetical protein